MGSSVGATNAGGTNTDTLSSSWPAGVQAGDIALMPWTFVNTAVPTDPTQDAMSLLDSNTDGSCTQRFLYRYCNGTESGTISTVTTGTGAFNRQSWVLQVLRGYQFISGFSVRLETVTGTSHANPSIDNLDGFNGNTPADGDTIVIITSTRDGATVSVVPPAGYAIRSGAEIGVVGSGGTHTAIADDGLTDSVVLPESPAAWTSYDASSGTAVTVTLALRPVSSDDFSGDAQTPQRVQTQTAAAKQSNAATSTSQRQSTASSATRQASAGSSVAQRAVVTSAGQKGVARSAATSQRTTSRAVSAKSAAGIARAQTRNSSATAGSGAQQSSAGTSASCRVSVLAAGNKGGLGSVSVRQRSRPSAQGFRSGSGNAFVQVRSRLAVSGSRAGSGTAAAVCRVQTAGSAHKTAVDSVLVAVRLTTSAAGSAVDTPIRDITLSGVLAGSRFLGVVEGNRFSGALLPVRLKGEVKW